MILIAIVIFVFILISFAYLFRAINSLIYTRLQVRRAWSNVDIIVQQKFNEISLLVSICEQYVKYEQTLLNLIISERDKYLSELNVPAKMEIESSINKYLNSVMGLVEKYPDLKANQHFININERLISLNSIIVGRKEFLNQAIAIYNTKISLFPGLIFAFILKYTEFKLWAIE